MEQNVRVNIPKVINISQTPLAGVTALSSYVQIEPVGQCNLSCTMCAIQFREDRPPYGPPAFMPLERFTTLEVPFTGISDLHLQGQGEPMMHPRFFDMVRYAASRGIRATTNTNLNLLYPKRAIARHAPTNATTTSFPYDMNRKEFE